MVFIVNSIKEYVLAHPYLSLFFTTFVSEDAAFFYALFAHELNVFYICGSYISGILLGDFMLYGAGYCSKTFQRKIFLKQMPKSLKKKSSTSSMDTWLMMTRFLPGTRLPTYTYLGYQGYSPIRFLSLLLISTFFQILIGFIFVAMFSNQIKSDQWMHKALIALCAMFCSIGFFKSIVFILKWKRLSLSALKVKFISYYRLIYKEFWPSAWTYCLMIPSFIYLNIKYRGAFYFLYCNPAIANSGIVGESKDDIDKVLQAVPKKFLLKQHLVNQSDSIAFVDLIAAMNGKGIAFPCYAKPVEGHKGLMVSKVDNEQELKHYFEKASFDFLVQEFSNQNCEMGLFFMKEQSGFEIFSITLKKFPYVIGDGEKTLEQLIMQNSYLKLFSPSYFKKHWQHWTTVIERNKKYTLTQTGNHSQGCIFKDGKHLNTPELRTILNDLLKNTHGINIGRFDLKYTMLNDEIDFNTIKIIELNGGGAEPTHIYDKDTSLREMFLSLYQQYDYMWRTGKLNYHTLERKWTLGSFLKDCYRYNKKTKHYL